MRVLLDTHVLLWWLSDDQALSRQHRDVIESLDHEVVVSAVSVAEVAIKASLGKLKAPRDVVGAIRESGLDLIDFTPEHAELLRDLPFHHRDPFDRMLVAQAMFERCAFATADEKILHYDVTVV
ncbi:MAG: type II toxin-antitoxin system VapC family toxin [Aeromicrobium sp.]|uniref:type II toxin-antitoxin system VapC family toxin n=1 Tax=Aeromicrobium sp. TaxID=1871063 RepID=UPI0039E6EFBA